MKFEKGNLVRINKIDVSTAHYGQNHHMKRMIGKNYTIQHVNETGDIISIKGWSWHPDDLGIPLECLKIEKLKNQKMHFNPKEIWL